MKNPLTRKNLPLHLRARKRNKRPEQALQIGIFNQLRVLMGLQRYEQFLAFHCPNGGARTEFEGKIFKEMGVMPGAPDIILLFPERKFDPAFIPIKTEGKPYWEGDENTYPKTVFVELKAGDKSGQNANQELFQRRAEGLGFEYHLISVLDLKDALNQIYAILMMNGVTGI